MYQTQRGKAIDFIDQCIIPVIKESADVDYDKVLSFLLIEQKISNKLAKECLDGFISQGKIKREGNILTIPDKEVNGWIKKSLEKKKEIENALELVGLK